MKSNTAERPRNPLGVSKSRRPAAAGQQTCGESESAMGDGAGRNRIDPMRNAGSQATSLDLPQTAIVKPHTLHSQDTTMMIPIQSRVPTSISTQSDPVKTVKSPLPVIYVALDFDGVLHHFWSSPSNELLQAVEAGEVTPAEFVGQVHKDNSENGAIGSLFECSAFVSEALRQYPQLRIVIATAWRHEMSLDTLRAVMPLSLARRTVGVLGGAQEKTPEHKVLPGVRGHLMEKWLRDRGEPEAPWVAVDDTAGHWDHHLSRLVKCKSVGMRLNQGQELLDRIGQMESSPEYIKACATI